MMLDEVQEERVRVLIADDQRPTRQGLRALLALLPHPVEVIGEAANGQDAVQLIVANQPDVVLMDMRMPVMDGLEATRRIKNQWPEVKVIALSMYPMYRTQAHAAGADVFLLKGCTAEELQAAIVATV